MIDAHPDFRPRAWIGELPALDAFGTLTFQVAGQQLSVRETPRAADALADDDAQRVRLRGNVAGIVLEHSPEFSAEPG